MTRILLADDHRMVRQGIRSLLEREALDVVGEATDGREAVQLAEHLRPDIAVLDLNMPGLNGVDTTRELTKVSPNTRSIVLTMYDGSRYVMDAMRAGARGYLLKTRAAGDLVQAIRDVITGGVYVNPEFAARKAADDGAPNDGLTPRERQVLQLIADGKSTKEVAVNLGMSVKTAECHRTRIMKKIDVHELASLVRYAIRTGVIQP